MKEDEDVTTPQGEDYTSEKAARKDGGEGIEPKSGKEMNPKPKFKKSDGKSGDAPAEQRNGYAHHVQGQLDDDLSLKREHDDDREQIKVTTFGQLVIEPESSNVAVLKTRDD